MTFHEYFLPRPDADLFVQEGGSGLLIIFLHAGVSDHRLWQHQMTALAATHRVMVYDRRGFGRTRCGQAAVSPVEDLLALIDHAGAERAILVGCSQGGRFAIDTALARPDRVAALYLIAPAVTGAPVPTSYPPDIQARLDALEAAEAAEDVDLVNAIEAQLWLDGPQAPAGRVGGAARDLFLDMNGIALRHAPVPLPDLPSAYGRVGELTCPVGIACGDMDFPHLLERCTYLHRTIPGAVAQIFSGCGHLPSLEKPDLVTSALQTWLSTLPTS